MSFAVMVYIDPFDSHREYLLAKFAFHHYCQAGYKKSFMSDRKHHFQLVQHSENMLGQILGLSVLVTIGKKKYSLSNDNQNDYSKQKKSRNFAAS